MASNSSWIIASDFALEIKAALGHSIEPIKSAYRPVSLPAGLPCASTRQQIRHQEYAEDQECAQYESIPEMVRKHVLISCLALSQQCILRLR
jgi:hypothetical protein